MNKHRNRLSSRHGIDQIKMEIGKNRGEFESRTRLILDYENRIITESAHFDKVKYKIEFEEACKKTPSITKLYTQNQHVFLTVHQNPELKIHEDVWKKFDIDTFFLKLLMKGITSKEKAMEVYSIKDLFSESENYWVSIPSLCYLMNIHPSELKTLISVIKKCIVFKILINYTKPANMELG